VAKGVEVAKLSFYYAAPRLTGVDFPSSRVSTPLRLRSGQALNHRLLELAPELAEGVHQSQPQSLEEINRAASSSPPLTEGLKQTIL